MTLRHRIRFYQQLAVLVRAGLPIRASLLRLKERLRERELDLLSQKVNSGERLGDAFIAAGFSSFECHLVLAGEKSAQLDTIFERLAEFWTRQMEMRQALIRPLYYPIAVLHLAVIALSLIELATLPASVVIDHLITRFALIYAGGFIVWILVRFSWSSEFGRRLWLWVPLVGGSLRTASAYRWITALKLEFVAGVSLISAVGDAWRASGYVGCDHFAAEGEKAMREGVQLSTLVQRWKRLPRDWIDFIETGEISGALEAAFDSLEAEAARAWRLAQDRLSDWGSKILYFIVLLAVGAYVGSVMMKVYIDPIVNAEKQIDDAEK